MRIEGVVIEAEAIGRIARPGSGRAAQAWWRAASREVDGTSSSLHFRRQGAASLIGAGHKVLARAVATRGSYGMIAAASGFLRQRVGETTPP